MLAIENVRDLEIVRIASEQGSFSAAARALGITQPAVSQAVARLERQLGATLFDRQESGRPGFLTDAGAVLVAHAITALDELDAAARDITELDGRSSVRVGLPSLLARVFFPLGLSPLSQLGREHQTEIVLHDSERLLEELRLHRVDVGMIASTQRGITLPHVSCAHVAAYPLVLAVRDADLPRQGGLGLAALARGRVPVVAFSGDLGLREEVDGLLRRDGLALNVVAVTDQSEMLCQMVAAGMGVGVASSLALEGLPGGVSTLVPQDAQVPVLNVFVFEYLRKAQGKEKETLALVKRLLFAAVRARQERATAE